MGNETIFDVASPKVRLDILSVNAKLNQTGPRRFVPTSFFIRRRPNRDGLKRILKGQSHACRIFYCPLIDQFSRDHVIHGNAHIHAKDPFRVIVAA